MTSQYKKQHYVPQTYLEAWNDSTGNIWVYNKNNDDLFRHGSTEKLLYENDFYTRKIDDWLILTERDKNKIFSFLNDYIIEFDGEKLNTVHAFHENYQYFNQWTIYEKDGSIISNRKKNDINNTIRQFRIVESELDWSKIENEWNVIREKITDSINRHVGTINENDLNLFFNFMVAQKWRTPKVLNDYREIVKVLFHGLEKDLGEDRCEELIDENTIAYFKKSIMRYQKGDESSHINLGVNLHKKQHVLFYEAVGRKSFLTSDCPVFILHDNNFFKGKYNGLYFPITPKILGAVYNGGNNKYSISTMPENMVRRFNIIIKENSFKYYVSNSEIHI